ncbi:CoA ester lyase [Desulfobacula sp.]|uniref:HpcH/HpaI aldolase/citrate lyase family protein n=1 Tax=Desulfobacula sp. TaxID=2593537 RepID=UPI00261BAB61|nr:CoA ester lyase [Desulfobacula sp.]
MKTNPMKPNRSNLSVPGHVKKMHGKAIDCAADVVMLDLEDSVPPDKKVTARELVVQSLRHMNWKEKTVTVRVNSLDTPFAYRDILDIAEKAGDIINAIVLPKIHHPGDVHFVSRLLDGIEMAKRFKREIQIEASIETARGMAAVSQIAQASRRLKTLVFGVADYSNSIGAGLMSISGHGENEANLYPGHRWHYSMSKMVMAAKANNLLAIDAPYGYFKDREGLCHSASLARALGFNGKWVIHPDQIDVVNQVFSPSPEDIKRAKTILDACEAAEHNGKGAIGIEGRMVDQATLRLAKTLWAQAAYLGLV